MSQTIKTPDIDGTWPVISDGCTKIDAPMIVPTTIAVACGKRITRRSPVAAVSFIWTLWCVRLRVGLKCYMTVQLMDFDFAVTRILAWTTQGQAAGLVRTLLIGLSKAIMLPAVHCIPRTPEFS